MFVTVEIKTSYVKAEASLLAILYKTGLFFVFLGEGCKFSSWGGGLLLYTGSVL